MIKSKKQMYIVIASFALILLLGTTTYAFFNYTRTGSPNSIKTGRIYFNSEQNGNLQLTNIFPVKSRDVNPNTLDSVSVAVMGDTTYIDGEEFRITITGVNNRFNNKEVPINYIAFYERNGSGVIGTSDNDYFNAREQKDASIYTLKETGQVKEGEQVLVGYIDNGETGINGTLTIKAYIDADRIAITDTYTEGDRYEVINNLSSEILSECASYLESINYNNFLQTGETLNDFCNGTGTIDGKTFQKTIDSGAFNSENLTYFVNHNIARYLGEDGTTDEWVHDREVFTTSEWNSFKNSAALISFKIKAESNEGIWVPKPVAAGTIESCPDCKFMYPTSVTLAVWNTYSETPTQITSGLYDNYEELLETTGKNYFLGVKLNNNNEVTNAYACGVKEGVPFCIEGTVDGSRYTDNQILLQGVDLWNNSCNANPSYTECGPWNNSGILSAFASNDGGARTGVSSSLECHIYSSGSFWCYE